MATAPLLAAGSTIVLKDGRRLTGNVGAVTSLAANPQAAQNDMASIALVDDNLRRIFVPTAQMVKIDEVESGEIQEKIAVHHAPPAASRARASKPSANWSISARSTSSAAVPCG